MANSAPPVRYVSVNIEDPNFDSAMRAAMNNIKLLEANCDGPKMMWADFKLLRIEVGSFAEDPDVLRRPLCRYEFQVSIRRESE